MKGKKTRELEEDSNDYSRYTHDTEGSLRCKKPELLLSIAPAGGRTVGHLLKILKLYVELGRRKGQIEIGWRRVNGQVS